MDGLLSDQSNLSLGEDSRLLTGDPVSASQPRTDSIPFAKRRVSGVAGGQEAACSLSNSWATGETLSSPDSPLRK